MKYLRKYNEMKYWGSIDTTESTKQHTKELEEQLNYLAESTPFTMDNITVGGLKLNNTTEKYVIRFKYVSDECDAVLASMSQLKKKKNAKSWSLFKNMIQKKINNISNEYEAKVKTELAKIFKRFAKKFDYDFTNGEQVLPDQMIVLHKIGIYWGLSMQHLNVDTIDQTPYLEVTVILTRDIKNKTTI
jgi:hypothetical protein